MKKVIFFLYYRSGSSIFRYLCGEEWVRLEQMGLIEEANIKRQELIDSGKPFYLPTIPKETCSVKHGSDGIFKTDIQNNQAWITHIGDWWGQLPSNRIPMPYEDKTWTKWSKQDLQKLPGDWNFVSLIRDGRNQIESLRNNKGGIEEKLNNQDSKDYFKVLCKAFRNRARLAIDCQELNNYTMFKFEDFISNPVSVMREMFIAADLSLNEEYCKSILKVVRQSDVEKAHSSFKDKSAVNQRWHNWSEEEILTFKEIAGKELEELGYSWSG